jgi:predicted RNase H-like nuclease (RuvC/YqgF family)
VPEEWEQVNGGMKVKSTTLIVVVLCTLLLPVYFYRQAYSQTTESQTLEARLTTLEQENQLLQVANETAQQKLTTLNSTLETLQQKLTTLNGTLAKYVLRYPTLEELKQFLANDTTSGHPRVKGTYDCMDFARDLKRHAAAAGWNMSYVVANFMLTWNGQTQGFGHAFNGVQLANGTMVWVEPQNDAIYSTPEDLILHMYLFPVQVSMIEVVVVW